MKKIEIINAVNALSQLPINKIKNDKVKFSLIANYRRLRKVSKEIDEDRDLLVKKFQEDWKEEIDLVAELRNNRLPVNGHDEFIKSERDLHKKLEDILQEEIQTEGLTPVDMNELLKAIGDTDLSFEAINNLDCIIA